MNKIIITAGSVLLALILLLTLVWPKYQDLRILQANVAEREVELQFKEDYFSQIKETALKLEDYDEPLAKVASALPENPSIADLFSFLHLNASQTGLLLEEITLTKVVLPKEPAVLKEILVSLELIGTYQSLKDFLSVIESSSRIIETDNLILDASDEEEVPEYSLKIKTYSY